MAAISFLSFAPFVGIGLSSAGAALLVVDDDDDDDDDSSSVVGGGGIKPSTIPSGRNNLC